MKNLTQYISIRKGNTTIVATNETIKQIVKDELDKLGHDADLNHIDVSEVTDMYCLFSCDYDDLWSRYGDLNPDISKWNIGKVEKTRCMFYECKNFNCDISGWDVSNVKNITYMFYRCENFNQDISRWDVSKVKHMNSMFWDCENFNQDISMWDVSNVEGMQYMFYKCKNFNKDISRWDVSNIENMNLMFEECPIKEEFKPKFNI